METASRNSNLPCARRWFLLAAGSLILSGLLALLLSLARTPILSGWVTDPVFFRRCLVVHVNLSLGVWLHSFMASLFFLLPGKPARRSGLAFSAAVVGVILMIAAGWIQGAPILSNYIPVVDNPVFLCGIALFGFGILATLLDGRMIPASGDSVLPSASFPGIRAAAIAFIAAMQVFGMSILLTPRNLGSDSYYEILFWGGGHVLIFSAEAAKLSVWIALLTMVTKTTPIERRWSVPLFAILALAPLASTVMAFQDPTTSAYNSFFITIMRWTIFPVSLIVMAFCVRHFVRHVASASITSFADHRVAGFVASAGLTVVGFIFGALIRNPSTLVPAHYHAAIGAVTVSFMAVAYELMPRLGFALPRRALWLVGRQPYIFGGGQIVFASGFALAGAAGMGRKLYGNEQHVKGMLDYIGLGLVGLGGVIAVLGGLIFLGVVVWAVINRIRVVQPLSILSETSVTKEDSVWKATANIPSRS